MLQIDTVSMSPFLRDYTVPRQTNNTPDEVQENICIYEDNHPCPREVQMLKI